MADGTTATIVFTDLVGSTELLDRAGDDVADQLRRIHFDVLRNEITAHGGTIVKSLGDGLMLVFTSAVDAVRCAAAMQRAVVADNARRTEWPLQMRVGISAGDVIREEGDYFGAPVVVAARLCAKCEGEQILISSVVEALVGRRGGVAFEAPRTLALKGLADPVAVCDVRWRDGTTAPPAAAVAPAEPVADPSVAAPTATTPTVPLPAALFSETESGCVGRSSELETLLAAFHAATRAERTLTVLAGEPGIGKTRLMCEVGKRAHDEGAIVLYGRCDEEGLLPFQPFVEALNHYARYRDADELRALAGTGARYLGRLVPIFDDGTDAAAASLDADTERFRMFQAFAAIFGQIATESTLVLLIDDLHWADNASLLLLKHLVRVSAGSRVFGIGTFRDADLDAKGNLAETLLTLRREHGVQTVTLRGLDTTALGQLVEQWAGQAAGPGFLAALQESTEGHPFFAKEVLRYLLETGSLHDAAGTIIHDLELSDVGIPDGVRAVVSSRLQLLAPETRAMLTTASVIGRDFPIGVLARVAGSTEDDVFDRLDDALGARLVEETPGRIDSFRFSHALIRATLYDELTDSRRARVHLRIAAAMEETGAAASALLPDLAHHYFEAATGSDSLEKAIVYSMLAGERAESQLAYDEAAGHFDRSVRGLALQGGDSDRHCRALLALGRCQWNAGRYRTGRTTFLHAAEMADRLGLIEQLGQAAIGGSGQVGFEVGITNDEVIRLLEHACDRIDATHPHLRCLLLARLAELLALGPRRGEVGGLCDEAEDLARQHGDPAVLAQVLCHLVWARWSPDNLDDRVAMSREICELAEPVSDLDRIFMGRAWHMAALLETGELDEGWASMATCVAVGRARHHPYWLWMAELLDGLRATVYDSLDVAERRAIEARLTGSALENISSHQLFGVQILWVRDLQARLAEMHAGTRYMVDYFSSIPALRAGLASVLAQMGRHDDAQLEVDALAVGGFRSIPFDMFWTNAMSLVADAAVLIGDHERAAEIYDLLVPYEHRFIVAGALAAGPGFVALPLGRLAAALGRRDAADAHFATAVALAERSGATVPLALARAHHASFLLELGTEEAEQRAAPLAAAALETAEQLGIRKVQLLLGVGADAYATLKPAKVRRLRAAVSTRGRAVLARTLSDTSDEDLERRFGNRVAQRTLFTTMAQSFQPSMAYGFTGQIEIELTSPGKETSWWTIDVQATKAVVRHGRSEDAVLSLSSSVPWFVRVFSGLANPVGAWLDGNMRAEGDIVAAPRVIDMFGGVDPNDVMAVS